MAPQQRLELSRRDLEPLVLDQLLQPIDDREVPVPVDAPDISRVQPPGGVERAAVASRLVRYPAITFRPPIRSSPASSGPRSAPVAASTIRHSVFGTSRPNGPGLHLPGSSELAWVTGLASVSPYP